MVDGDCVADQLLVLCNNVISQVELDNGEVTATIEVPDDESDQAAEELCVLSDGRIAVKNGKWTPLLSVWDPADEAWTTFDPEDWFGPVDTGLGCLGSSVFMASYKWSDVYRFDLDTREVVSTTNKYVTAMTIGLGGLLYLLSTDAFDPEIDVLDPDTLEVLDTYVGAFDDSTSLNFAVDADGRVYIATWHGEVYRMDGTTTICVDIPGISFIDIDVAPDGTVVVGERFGEFYVMDADLNVYEAWEPTSWENYVAFGSL